MILKVCKNVCRNLHDFLYRFEIYFILYNPYNKILYITEYVKLLAILILNVLLC